MGLKHFFHFSPAKYREEIASRDLAWLRREEVVQLRAVNGAGFGMAGGFVAAPLTAGISLVATGIGARRLSVSERKLAIIREILKANGQPLHIETKEDTIIPLVANIVGFGVGGVVGVGLDQEFIAPTDPSGVAAPADAGAGPAATGQSGGEAAIQALGAGAARAAVIAAVTEALENAVKPVPRSEMSVQVHERRGHPQSLRSEWAIDAESASKIRYLQTQIANVLATYRLREEYEISVVQTYPRMDFHREWQRVWTRNITPRPPFFKHQVGELKADMLNAKAKTIGPFLELIRGIPPGLVKGRLSKYQIRDLEKKMDRFHKANGIYGSCLDAYEDSAYRNLRHRKLVREIGYSVAGIILPMVVIAFVPQRVARTVLKSLSIVSLIYTFYFYVLLYRNS